MSLPADIPPGAPEAVRAILQLAEEDRRRGIHYWHDPGLAGALRDLVREADSGSATTPVSRRDPAPGLSAPARPAPASSSPTGPLSATAPTGPLLGSAPIRPSTAAAPKPPDAAATVGPAAPAWVDRPTSTARPAAEPPGEPPSVGRPAAIWVRSAAPASRRETAGGARPGSSGEPAAAGFAAGGPRAPRPEWGPPPAAIGRAADWETQLRAVEAEATACMACGLCGTRRHVVFGTGGARVPLVFVGEAPGADEDAQGVPFVGRAGQLLTRIIAAIGLSREDVYICNVLKCRPPENRNPAPDEIVNCSPFLERQLDLLRPKVICTLGLFASQTLLQSTAPIGKLRGRVFERRGVKVLPTYHPAALLRNPNLKAVVWEDVQLLRKILDE